LLNQLSLQINSTLDAHKMVDKVAHSKLNELIANDLVTFFYSLGEELFLTIYTSVPSLNGEIVEKLKYDSLKEYTRCSGKKLSESDIQTKVIKRKSTNKVPAEKHLLADDNTIFIPLKVADNVLV